MNNGVTPLPAAPCPRCGQPVGCGIAAGESQCWCFALPRLTSPLGDGQSCLCRRCLAELQAAATTAGPAGPASLTDETRR